MEYVCLVNMYHNCRKHDGVTDTIVKFFENTESLMDFILKEMNACEVVKIYNSDGEHLDIGITYHMDTHNVIGITIKDEDGVQVRTMDDGHGKLIWNKDEER